MKKLSLLFLTLLCTISAFAVTTVNLQGGTGSFPTTNDALWTAFKKDFNAYYQFEPTTPGGNGYRDHPINQAHTTINNFMSAPALGSTAFVTSTSERNGQAPWNWLGDYIKEKAKSTPSSCTAWGYTLASFFRAINPQTYGPWVDANEKDGYTNALGDWTSAGKPSAWLPYYLINSGVRPQKAGAVFDHWASDAAGNNHINTVAQAQSVSTVYAIYRESKITYHYEGGEVVSITPTVEESSKGITANHLLWELFKLDYNAWYRTHLPSGYTHPDTGEAVWKERGDQVMANAASFADKYMKDFVTNEKSPWRWLGDHVKKVTEGEKKPLNTEILWRFGVAAFFNKKKAEASTYNGNADFSAQGDVKSWEPYYYFYNPPYKRGYVFYAWYTAPDKGGTEIADFDQTIKPTPLTDVYAGWDLAPKPTSGTFINFKPVLTKDSVFETSVTTVPVNSRLEGITWESSNPEIVSVHQFGTLDPYKAVVKAEKSPTSLAEGTVVISIKCDDVTFASATVVVAQQPAAEAQTAIYAYELNSSYTAGAEENKGTYHVSFTVNTAVNGDATIYVADSAAFANAGSNWANASLTKYTQVVPQSAIIAPGHNSVDVLEADVLAAIADGSSKKLVWAVEVSGAPVTQYGIIHAGAREGGLTGVLAVNKNPQTPNFGRVYTFFHNETASESGSYIFNPLNFAGTKNPPQTGHDFTWDHIARMAIDSEGDVYLTDKGSDNPGIFVGRVDENHPDIMPIYRFFPKTTTTVTTGEYPIIKDASGNEIGSAFMAVDTYVKTVSGKPHGILFGYAKGHAKGETGTIPYHSIVEYDLGEVGADGAKNLDTAFIAGKTKMSVLPILGNDHAAHTANIWATSKGLWICHDRGEGQNTPEAASLMFYGPSGLTYASVEGIAGLALSNADKAANKYITGTAGAAFAVNDDNSILVLQDAIDRLLVFGITWNGNDPTLTLKNVYSHPLGAINQMNFDYAGNLLVAGEKGLSVIALPDVHSAAGNKRMTLARNRFYLNQARNYECEFVDKVGDKKWSNRANWVNSYYPTEYDRVIIKSDVILDTDAQVVNLAMLASGDSYKKITVTTDKTLTVSDKMCWVKDAKPEGEVAAIGDGVHIVIEPNAALIYKELTGNPTAEVDLIGSAVKGSADNPWQQIAVPFRQNSASANFYGTWLYEWSELNAGWSAIGTTIPMELFHGYMLTQKAATEYGLKGKLPATNPDQTMPLSYSTAGVAEGVEGLNLLGNSWVAPIKISDMVFTKAESTVWGYTHTTGTKGQYAAWPIKQEGFKDNMILPSQAFFVDAQETGASVVLKHPLPPTKVMAPAPRKAPEMEVPNLRMKINVTGEGGEADELYIFESAKYSYDFDDGYESTKVAGDAGTPYLTASTAVGELAVVATPSFDGTMLNFRQGKTAVYTFTFEYDEEEVYYLEDTHADMFTEIRTGNSYFFTASEDDSDRFRIVRKPEQGDIATGTLNVWTANNTLFMENPLGEEVEVCVYGTDGKLVQGFTTRERILQLDVPLTGVYTVQLRTNDNVQTLKCIL